MKQSKKAPPPKDSVAEFAKAVVDELKKDSPAKTPKDKPTTLDLANAFMKTHEQLDVLYRYGESVVVIDDGKMKSLSNQDLACDVREQFPKFNKSIIAEITSHVLHTRKNTLKRINTFTTKPVFVGPAMELITTPGFANGVYYEPPTELAGVVFRTDADLAVAQASLETLKEPLKDFPIPIEDGRNIYLSMLLTLLLRPAIDDIVPCFFIRGNSQSLGKGLLSEMCSLIIFGERAASISEPKDDSEWQSRIEAILMKGQQFCVIDNIVGNLNAPFFASVLTSDKRSCRILGTSDLRCVPMNTVFSVNGNNVDTGSDLEERVAMICLEHPDARSRMINDFHIQKTYGQSPDTFVKQRRAEFLQHLINLVCAWKNAGSPAREKLTMSKYISWESVVGGIFDFVAPNAEFLSSNNANRAEANAEDQEMVEFIEAIIQRFPGCNTTPVTAKQIFQATQEFDSDLRIHLPDILRLSDEGYFSNRIGRLLRNASSRRFDGYAIQVDKAPEHKNRYLIVDTKPERHPHMHQPQQQITTQPTPTAEQEAAPPVVDRTKLQERIALMEKPVECVWSVSPKGNPHTGIECDDIKLHATVFLKDQNFHFVISEGEDDKKKEFSKTSYDTADAAKKRAEEKLQKRIDDARKKLVELWNRTEPDLIADAVALPPAKKKPTRSEVLDNLRKIINKMPATTVCESCPGCGSPWTGNGWCQKCHKSAREWGLKWDRGDWVKYDAAGGNQK